MANHCGPAAATRRSFIIECWGDSCAASSVGPAPRDSTPGQPDAPRRPRAAAARRAAAATAPPRRGGHACRGRGCSAGGVSAVSNPGCRRRTSAQTQIAPVHRAKSASRGLRCASDTDLNHPGCPLLRCRPCPGLPALPRGPDPALPGWHGLADDRRSRRPNRPGCQSHRGCADCLSHLRQLGRESRLRARVLSARAPAIRRERTC
jgi:hypothetical protein